MKVVSFSILLVAVCVEVAFGHAHISIDTAAGAVGDPIIIRAGYNPDESHVSTGASRRLLDDGDPYIVTMDTVQVGGTYDGWLTAAGDINPTSDAFYFTGHLGTGWNGATYAAPGGFAYEIFQITRILGPANARFVITWTTGGPGTADSDALTQAGRSVPVPAGTHRHGYTWYFSEQGVYDVTLRAWDAGGQFVSVPGGVSDVTFRINAVPEPGSGVVMIVGVGLLGKRRTRRARRREKNLTRINRISRISEEN